MQAEAPVKLKYEWLGPSQFCGYYKPYIASWGVCHWVAIWHHIRGVTMPKLVAVKSPMLHFLIFSLHFCWAKRIAHNMFCLLFLLIETKNIQWLYCTSHVWCLCWWLWATMKSPWKSPFDFETTIFHNQIIICHG